MEILKKYYVEEQRAELEYLRSGDADLYCRKKEEIRHTITCKSRFVGRGFIWTFIV